jgi:tetratricopeptide (TPR) repeat protein
VSSDAGNAAPGPAQDRGTEDTADPVRERISRDLDKNVMLQYGFSKAARLSRNGQLADAAAEYAKLSKAADKPHLKALAFVLQAEMLLRDPPTVLDTAAAREALEQAHALGAPQREWTFTLGMLALRDDRLTEARDLLRRSFAQAHQPQEAAAYLAVVEARSGELDVGRQWLDLAREYGEAWRSPEAEIALRNPDDPVSGLRAAIAEHPEEYWLRLALARELTAAGRHDELVETNREMAADRDLPERFRAAAALGAARTLLLHTGDDRIGEAMKLAGQARTLAPKSLAVWEVLSLGYCRDGHFRRAAGAARRVLRADPDSATAGYVRAWALGARGSCEQARAALQEAISRDPEWPLREKAADAVSGCR